MIWLTDLLRVERERGNVMNKLKTDHRCWIRGCELAYRPVRSRAERGERECDKKSKFKNADHC